MPNICPDCQVWEVLPIDNFCSFCKRKFISIGISLTPTHIPAGEIRQIALVIHNLSDEKPIQVNAIRGSADWVTGDFSRVALPFSLLPKTDFEILMFADSEGLEAAVAEVSVESNAGNDAAQLEVFPASEVRLETDHWGKFELVLDDEHKEQIAVRVPVAAGKVTLQSIAVTPPGVCTPVPAFSLPAELSASAAAAEFQLRFNKEMLGRMQAGPKREVNCRVSGQFSDPFGNEFERGADLTVSCWYPPKMLVWEEYDPTWEGCTGEPHIVRLTIQNADRAQVDPQGRAPLEIRGVEAMDLSGAAIPWMERVTDLSQPLHIASGQTEHVKFKVFPQSSGVADHAEAGPGEHVVQFAFSTNLSKEHPPLKFLFIVRDAPIFNGVLAIDFGTSNSCAALLGWTDEECTMGRIERWDGVDDQTKSPTLVQFESLEGDQAVTEYGAKVMSRLSAPETLNSVVQSVKRLLGRVDDFDRIPVQFQQNKILRRRYLPREVTTFYLKHVRQSIEKNSGLRFRRLAITHPARFKLRQIEDLKQAVREAFGEVVLTCYQEPIAAGLEHILMGAEENPDAYTLGVFDCGGGTTDLSLIRVEKSRKTGLEELNATLLASTGKWFGGEDLTIEVRRLAVKKIQAILGEKGAGTLLIQGEEKPELRSFARQNELRLWDWAEKVKLELVYPNGPPSGDPYPLMALTPSGLEPQPFKSVNIRPDAAEVVDYLRRHINEMADMLQSLVTTHQVARLDSILMSGMTSSIPLVRTILQEKFPNSKVVPSPDPKKCVAKGACYLEAIFQDSVAMKLKVHGRAATVSRIGFADRGRSFARRFTALIPAGVPIPDAGLRVPGTFSLRPDSIVELLENDADDDRLGSNNPNISLIGRFRPNFQLPADGAVVEVELCVNPDLECTLSGRLAGSQDSFNAFVRVPADEARH